MKIEKKKISEFLAKFTMEGKMCVEEAIFDFTDTKVIASSLTGGNIGRIDASLDSSAFIEYEGIGKIGLQNIPDLVKICNVFSKEITLTVEGNLLTLKEGSKKVEIELVDVQYITECAPMEKVLEFDEIFKIDPKPLNEFFDNAMMNKEPVLVFETKPKTLILNNTGKYKWTHNIASEEIKGGVSVKFGDLFISAIKNLNHKIEFNMKSNYPIRIIEQTSESKITILIAPRVEKTKEK